MATSLSPSTLCRRESTPDACADESSDMPCCHAGQESWDGFFRGSDPQQAVALSAFELNFGSCSRLSPGGHKTLTVSNTTNAKVTAFLVVPAWQGHGSQTHMHQVFQVSIPYPATRTRGAPLKEPGGSPFLVPSTARLTCTRSFR